MLLAQSQKIWMLAIASMQQQAMVAWRGPRADRANIVAAAAPVTTVVVSAGLLILPSCFVCVYTASAAQTRTGLWPAYTAGRHEIRPAPST
jgi:hypothetical protein